MKKTHVSIIGLGTVGSHLSYSLRKTGKYKIHNGLNDKSKIIFITTQDSKIPSGVKMLTSGVINTKGKYVYHTSGVLTSGVLMPLKKRGAETGSFHPVQTFENKASGKNPVSRFKNIYIVLEGSKKAILKSSQLARDLSANPIIINKKNKVLHHICCVAGSNYIVTLMHAMNELGIRIRKNGFNKLGFFSIYEPLILRTLNNVKTKGPVRSLTGPIERNDTATIKLHLSELRKKIPSFLPFYKFLAKETAAIALKKRSLNKKQYDKLKKILK